VDVVAEPRSVRDDPKIGNLDDLDQGRMTAAFRNSIWRKVRDDGFNVSFDPSTVAEDCCAIP
jgi:hypothetical protein